MDAITNEQLAGWRRDGFLFPFPMLDEAERQECLDGLARYERWLGVRVSAAENKWRSMPYCMLPWAARLAQDTRILDVVEELIGPDILIYTSTFFIKEAYSPTVAAWHQDSTYYGLEPAEEVTVWIALTNASEAAGCMEVLSFSGNPRQLRHEADVVTNSVNKGGQRIAEPLDDSRPVAMPLPAGSYSMHHGLCPHRSGPNSTPDRRIGLGLNYIPAYVRSLGPARPAAMLVRGVDRFGNFELLEAPKAELDADGVAAHARATALYHENYVAQKARHAHQGL